MNALSISLLVVLLSTLAGCGDKAVGSKTEAAAPSVAAKSDARADMIKSLEARAAQSDADAQLSLAKTLLDGSVTPPDYERAKGLLVSASEKGLPEAIYGLYLLRASKTINDDNLPDSNTLKAQALATHDPFVALFLIQPPSYPNPVDPPELVVKLADSGYPLANAQMAHYYGQIASGVARCRRSDEFNKQINELNKQFKERKSKSESDRCSRLSRIPDSFKRAISYASKILDANEVDADKVRYWSLLRRRITASRPKAPDNFSSPLIQMPPLIQMQSDYVWNKADPYFSVFAGALRTAGMLLKDGKDFSHNLAQAAQFLKRAAELGDDIAQNAMGELYQSGQGVTKDFEMAARYFAQSAQQGDEDGAKNIGLAFARGQGVERNPIQAYFWLSISALSDTSQTQLNYFDTRKLEQLVPSHPALLRDKLAQSMKGEEIAEAQRLAREWRPSYQVGPPPIIASLNSAGSTSPDGKLSKQGTGTAFAVSTDGHALTNHHVINGCTEVKVAGREGIVKVITSDSVNDLALLQLPGKTKDIASLNPDPGKLRQGEDIIVFGYPLEWALSSGGNLTPGIISALTGLGNNTSQIQITAPIQPGSSGSPVMDKKGDVVGMVSMKLSDAKMAKATGSVGQNVNFAVNGQTVKAFLDANKVPYKTGGGLFSREKSNADIAEEASKWTVLVECWK